MDSTAPAFRPSDPTVVFVTCHLPYPPSSGGKRREFELLRLISESWRVELYAVCKDQEDWRHADTLREWCDEIRLFPAEPVPADDPDAAVDRVLMHRSAALSHALGERLSGSSVLVHVEGSYLMDHLPDAHLGPVLLLEQNVESRLWLQRAECAPDEGAVSCRRAYWRNRVLEQRAWERATALAAVCERDAAEMRGRTGRPVTVVPDGADHLPARRDGPLSWVPTAAMVSNFGYEPNVDAASFLAEDVLPLLRSQVPDARLLLVGRAPPREIRSLARIDRVEVTGTVPSVQPYLEAAHVVVCPHRIGGGVKVQVLEALAAGKALVASDVALQGVPERARTLLEPAADASAFAGRIAGTLRDEGTRLRMERTSRAAAALLPSWDDAADQLEVAYDRLVTPALKAA
jgi:polysaccharide biosynthesis protein PslH